MRSPTAVLDQARNILTERKMLCNDATENNRNTILMAIFLLLYYNSAPSEGGA